MEFAELFGYAGTVTAVSFMIPQVWKTWRTKSVRDISWGMLAILFLNCIFWFIYGVLLDRAPLMLANGVAFVVICAQIALKVRYRSNP